MNEGPKGGGRQGHMMDGQTGNGSNGGQKGGAPQGPMTERGQMMGGMADLGQQMSEMMGTASSRMKDLPEGDLKTMAGLMKDMGQQMVAMSQVMGNGKVSAKDMNRKGGDYVVEFDCTDAGAVGMVSDESVHRGTTPSGPCTCSRWSSW